MDIVHQANGGQCWELHVCDEECLQWPPEGEKSRMVILDDCWTLGAQEIRFERVNSGEGGERKGKAEKGANIEGVININPNSRFSFEDVRSLSRCDALSGQRLCQRWSEDHHRRGGQEQTDGNTLGRCSIPNQVGFNSEVRYLPTILLTDYIMDKR